MFDLDEFTDDMVNLAKENLEKLKSDGDFLPVCFVVLPSGQTHLLGVPHSSDEEKDAVFKFVSKYAKDQNAIAVVAINDTWTAIQEKDAPYIRPVNHPERKEALVASLILPDGSLAKMIINRYHREGGVVVWEKREVNESAPGAQGGHQYMIPAWGKLGRAQ